MNRLIALVRQWLARGGSRGPGGGLLGRPGDTQRPGRSSGGPGEGPLTGGSAGPSGPSL